jgi:hypothetical protein
MRSPAVTAKTSADIPEANRYFYAVPGADRVLIQWHDMLAYFRMIALESERVACESIGTSTEGREMVLITIAHPDVLRDLELHRQRRAVLTDPEMLRNTMQRVNSGKGVNAAAGTHAVVLVTSAIHATEVGSVQLCPELIHHFATSNDAQTLEMLENVILLIVPSLNPDGMALVHDWYQETLNTRAEGTVPPALYHRHAGHDNNRDWIHQQLVETRNIVTRIHRAWRPHIVLDLHQMMTNGPRYFVPPYIDPIEGNVHPTIVAGGTALGAHIATRMVAHRFEGTTSGVLFDAFSPSRAYSHYHGCVRILAEAASARIASPVEVGLGDLTPSRGFDPRRSGVHNLLPWHGGSWRLRDIMNYHREAVLATIEHAASNRDAWIDRQWRVLAETLENPDTVSYLIPPLEHQIDPAATRELLRILAAAEVEIATLQEPTQDVNGVQHGRGSFLVTGNQPFAGWAHALLPPTIYLDTDPGSRPYDTTSHSLSVQMGVEIVTVSGTAGWKASPLDLTLLDRIRPLEEQRAGGGRWIALDARSHETIQLVSHALRTGTRVRRLVRAHFSEGRVFDAGTWILSGASLERVVSRAEQLAVRTWSILPVAEGMVEQRQPRIGVHVASRHNATDGGWSRLVLERHGIPHDILSDEDVRSSSLAGFDVILLPHLSAMALSQRHVADGYPEGFDEVLGQAGFSLLKAFASSGGRIVAVDGAAQACIAQFDLPVEVPLVGMDDSEFYAPGAMIRTDVDVNHPLTWGVQSSMPCMVNGKTAFRRLGPNSTYKAPIRYPSGDLVVSGWMRGEQHLAGLDAVVNVPIGDGAITLMSLRPVFRAQTHVTFNLLFNSLYLAGLEVMET